MQINLFKNKRKKKFLNRLKYGQDEQPIYNSKTLTDALMDGDTKKAQEILNEIMKIEKITSQKYFRHLLKEK